MPNWGLPKPLHFLHILKKKNAKLDQFSHAIVVEVSVGGIFDEDLQKYFMSDRESKVLTLSQKILVIPIPISIAEVWDYVSDLVRMEPIRLTMKHGVHLLLQITDDRFDINFERQKRNWREAVLLDDDTIVDTSGHVQLVVVTDGSAEIDEGDEAMDVGDESDEFESNEEDMERSVIDQHELDDLNLDLFSDNEDKKKHSGRRKREEVILVFFPLYWLVSG